MDKAQRILEGPSLAESPACPYCSARLRGWIAPPARMGAAEEFTLQVVLDHIGLPEISAKVPHAKPGYIEALINAELLQVDSKTDERRWYQLHCAKMTARSIRKPICEFGEYVSWADRALAS